MMFRILAFLLLPVICLAQVNTNGEKPTGELLTNEISPNEMKRNASFNLDEIKVRWKKVALENCPGVPCVSFSAPGPVTSIVATPTGPTSASVAFVPPASNGGSPITGYIVTATSTTPSAPAKRKSSATIIVEGTSSPISVTGLVFGVNYTFSVVAINVAGGSTPTVTVTTVTPCTLNTAIAALNLPALTLNSLIETPIAISSTTGATGIGTATGLPTGVTATWSNNSIKISGTPTAANTFNYTIPLTGGCGSVEAKGTIVVEAAPPSCISSFNPTIPSIKVSVLIETPYILVATIGVTSIGTPTGLPPGTVVSFGNNQIILTGYPTTTGEYLINIPLIGLGCGPQAQAQGTIVVEAAPLCELPVNNPTFILSGSELPLDFEIGATPLGVTSIEYNTGLPSGTILEWKLDKLYLKGIPTGEIKPYIFTYYLKGGACDNRLANGEIVLQQGPF